MTALTPTDWKNAKGYVDILKPFHDATKIEEGESYVTLSMVLPVLNVLFDRTKAYYLNRNHAGYGITFARNVLGSIEIRFGKYPQFLLRKPHCLATFTDPQFFLMKK